MQGQEVKLPVDGHHRSPISRLEAEAPIFSLQRCGVCAISGTGPNRTACGSNSPQIGLSLYSLGPASPGTSTGSARWSRSQLVGYSPVTGVAVEGPDQAAKQSRRKWRQSGRLR